MAVIRAPGDGSDRLPSVGGEVAPGGGRLIPDDRPGYRSFVTPEHEARWAEILARREPNARAVEVSFNPVSRAAAAERRELEAEQRRRELGDSRTNLRLAHAAGLEAASEVERLEMAIGKAQGFRNEVESRKLELEQM
jgi:hypothetical protein